MVLKFAPLVNNQIEYWLSQIERHGPGSPRYNGKKIAAYRHLVREFSQLLTYLNAQEGTDLKPDPANRRIARSPQERIAPEPPKAQERTAPVAPVKTDLADLPPELLAELSDGAKAETDPLVQIINARGGTATLDEILIDLYRNYNEIGKRVPTGNKLYRLGRRNLVWSVPGKKGMYTTIKPEGVSSDKEDKELGNDEGPDAATSGPSSTTAGAAGSPEGPSKPSPNGSSPSASTIRRRDLFSSAAIPPTRIPR